MTDEAQKQGLMLCPFCGGEAKSDNGFMPLESIEYVWCTNQACKLSDHDIGFTPETWNTRTDEREKMLGFGYHVLRFINADGQTLQTVEQLLSEFDAHWKGLGNDR